MDVTLIQFDKLTLPQLAALWLGDVLPFNKLAPIVNLASPQTEAEAKFRTNFLNWWTSKLGRRLKKLQRTLAIQSAQALVDDVSFDPDFTRWQEENVRPPHNMWS